MDTAYPAIPFFRLELDDVDVAAVVSVLRSGWLTSGPQVALFEAEFAEFVRGGVKAAAVASATAGMHLALEALGIGPGDEVIVPTLTFTATAEAARCLGARVRLVDVDRRTLCIDPEQVAEAISPETRCIMPVHFGGLPCDMAKIYAAAEPRGIPVVDDAAHALPAAIDGVHVGASLSAATVFSFYPNKTMTTGEGGMIVSRLDAIIDRCKVTRFHGIDRQPLQRASTSRSEAVYDVVAAGFKYNMTDIAASLGRSQIGRVSKSHLNRSRIAKRYLKAFGDLPLVPPPQPQPNEMHSWHLFPIQLESAERRDRFVRHLAANQVGFSIHYKPLHQMTYWRQLYDLNDERFPVATHYAARCVSLPIFGSMRDDEVSRVVEVVRGAFD